MKLVKIMLSVVAALAIIASANVASADFNADAAAELNRWDDNNRWDRGGRDDRGRPGRGGWGHDRDRDRNRGGWDRDRDRGGHNRGGRGSFSVSRMGNGVVDCQDTYLGGQHGAYLTSCIDIGQGRNHACRQVSATGCLAQEGRSNHGTPGCLAYCSR